MSKVPASLILWLLVSTAVRIQAEDIYIAQNALGGEMNSAATATNLDWFNTSGNWGVGASKISAGDTVHFVGILTNTATVQASGTAGSNIRLQAESGCRWLLWPNIATYAINLGANNYLTVDGGSDGYIQYTNNGTLLTYQLVVTGIYGTPTIGNIVISNWRCTNVFIFDTGAAGVTQAGSTVGLSGTGITNLLIHNITTHWAQKGIMLNYNGSGNHNWTLCSNVAQNCSWGMAGGDSNGDDFLVNLYVHHNQSDGHGAWYSSNNYYHNNGSYFWAENSNSYISNSFYYANRHGPDVYNSTAAIFTSASAGGGIFQCNIYNNVIIANPGAAMQIFIWKGADARVFNNTIAGVNGTPCVRFYGITGTVLNKNNVFWNVGNPTIIPNADLGLLASDYNSFSALNPFGGAWGESSSINYATWTSYGFEANSITANPLLTDTNLTTAFNGHLMTGSPAIGAAVNLSSLGYPDINLDFDGVPRGSSWDIGAYEFAVNPRSIAGGRVAFGGRVSR